jgi:hypothetical protein
MMISFRNCSSIEQELPARTFEGADQSYTAFAAEHASIGCFFTVFGKSTSWRGKPVENFTD